MWGTLVGLRHAPSDVGFPPHRCFYLNFNATTPAEGLTRYPIHPHDYSHAPPLRRHPRPNPPPTRTSLCCCLQLVA